MVSNLLPAGMRGLMVAGMLSALMSSLAAVFNSSATLFTMDIWRSFRPESSDRQLVWIGRVATVVVALVSIAWAPIIPHLSPQVWVYGMMISSYLAPPVMCASVFGIVWARANALGALSAMGTGFALGIFRFSLDLFNSLNDGRPVSGVPVLGWIVDLNYLVFGVCSLCVCLVVMIVVSLATQPPTREQIELYTFFPNGFLPELRQFVDDCRSGAIWTQARGLHPVRDQSPHPGIYELADDEHDENLASRTVELQTLTPDGHEVAARETNGTGEDDCETDAPLPYEEFERNRKWNIINAVSTLAVMITITALIIAFA